MSTPNQVVLMTPNQADKQVLAQAILRHKEREARQKREIPIPKGDGWVSKGSLHDCNRRAFQRALEAYWSKLYVGWNPMKREGRGCWEVWQQPSKKTPILEYLNEATGERIYRMEYQVNDFEHWVADLEYLSLGFIRRLREMDSWDNKQLISDHDYQHAKHQEQADEKETEAIKYLVKHERRLFRDALDQYKSK